MNQAILERIETILILRLLDGKEESNVTNIEVNESSQDGRTLLHFACDYGLEELSSALISVGAQVNMTDNSGTTPLMIAASRGYHRIVQQLLQANADPTITNLYGVDCLAMTLTNLNQEIFYRIKEITKSIFYNSVIGQISAVHIASALGATDFLKILCREHSDIVNTPTERSGMTCLMLATNGQHQSTVEALLELGAEQIVIDSTATRQIDLNMEICSIEPSFHIDYSTSEKIKSNFLSTNICTPQHNIFRSKHPLTPNICPSPKSRRDKTRNIRVKGFLPFKNFKRRSKSVENKTTVLKTRTDPEGRDILEYVLISTELHDCWPLFKSNEINYKTFITMNDEDLRSIGIMKSSLRNRILKVIKHNKRVFC